MGSSGSKSKKRNTDRTRLVNDAVRKQEQLLKVQNDARANKEEYKKSQKAARRRQQELLKKQQDDRKQQVRKHQHLLKLRKPQEQARREKSLNERLAKLTYCLFLWSCGFRAYLQFLCRRERVQINRIELAYLSKLRTTSRLLATPR